MITCKLKKPVQVGVRNYVVICNQNSNCEAKVFDAMYILNVCCVVTMVSRHLSARHTPTYERPTSYQVKWLLQIQTHYFHQMGLLLICRKPTEYVAGIDPVQYTRELLLKCMYMRRCSACTNRAFVT